MSKTKFAKLAGVNPSTVTRVCRTILAAAVVGKQIDINHPDVVAYLEKRDDADTPPPATGIDPLYEKAISACIAAERWSVSHIQRACRIGYNRASRIRDTMEANGVIDNVTLTSDSAPDLVVPAEYAERLRKPVGAAAVKEAKKTAPPEDKTIEIPDHLSEFLDYTLRDLCNQFGTDQRFCDWLKATQTIEAINEKRLKNAATEGKLISRQLVQDQVIDKFDSLFTRLLTDGVKTISGRSHDIAKAGGSVQDIAAVIEDLIGSLVRPVKVKVAKALRDGI